MVTYECGHVFGDVHGGENDVYNEGKFGASGEKPGESRNDRPAETDPCSRKNFDSVVSVCEGSRCNSARNGKRKVNRLQ